VSYNWGTNRARTFKSASRFALVLFWNYSCDSSQHQVNNQPSCTTNMFWLVTISIFGVYFDWQLFTVVTLTTRRSSVGVGTGWLRSGMLILETIRILWLDTQERCIVCSLMMTSSRLARQTALCDYGAIKVFCFTHWRSISALYGVCVSEEIDSFPVETGSALQSGMWRKASCWVCYTVTQPYSTSCGLTTPSLSQRHLTHQGQ